MNNEYTFDNISFGRHFMTNDGCRYIKIKDVTPWWGWSVWYQDNYGNKNKFNAISYAGDPRNIKFDEKVLVFDPAPFDPVDFDKLLRAEAQTHLNNLVEEIMKKDVYSAVGFTAGKMDNIPLVEKCSIFKCGDPAVWKFTLGSCDNNPKFICQRCYDLNGWSKAIRYGWNEGIKITLDKSKDDVKVVESKASTNVADVNKETKTEVKKMNTYQKLSEAVVAAITELKSAGVLSRYQVTKLIREKTNRNEWEVSECATQGGGNIKFWISRDAVRTAMDELYNDGELAALGFTGTNDNGTYLEYKFDVNPPVNQPVGPPGSVSNPIPLNVANQPITSVPSNTNYSTNRTTGRVQSFLTRSAGRTVTLKQIQSAIKEKGVLCGDILNIVESLGYPVYRTTATSDCPSTFTVLP